MPKAGEAITPAFLEFQLKLMAIRARLPPQPKAPYFSWNRQLGPHVTWALILVKFSRFQQFQ
jgi:hypothetical protein